MIHLIDPSSRAPVKVTAFREDVYGQDNPQEILEVFGDQRSDWRYVEEDKAIYRAFDGVVVSVKCAGPDDPIFALLTDDKPKSVSEFFSRS